MIGLIDNHNLESLPCCLIDLLRLSDLLQELLHHHTIKIPDIGRRNLEVVDRGDDIELQFAIGGGLKDARVDLDLLNPRTVELFECCDYPSLLASSRRTVDQEVREISTLCLQLSASTLSVKACKPTSDFNRVESS